MQLGLCPGRLVLDAGIRITDLQDGTDASGQPALRRDVSCDTPMCAVTARTGSESLHYICRAPCDGMGLDAYKLIVPKDFTSITTLEPSDTLEMTKPASIWPPNNAWLNYCPGLVQK